MDIVIARNEMPLGWAVLCIGEQGPFARELYRTQTEAVARMNELQAIIEEARRDLVKA